MKVLVAESNGNVRERLTAWLGKIGFIGEGCGSGFEVLGKLYSEELPSLLILDSGLQDLPMEELCAKIRDAEPDRLTYILLMTYGASREEAIRGLRAGADDCIAKPFRLEELLLRISAAHRAIDLSEQNRLQRTLLGRAADILASRGIHVSNAGASEAVVREIARALGAIGQVGKRIECRVDAGEMPEVPWESRALKNFFKSIR